MGLKIVIFSSPWMASPAYKISWNLPISSKVIGGTDRQTGDLI